MKLKYREMMEFTRGGPWAFLQAADLMDGPYPCDKCKQMSCFTHITHDTNRQFCKNPRCDYERVIDKRNKVIKEPDGTFWRWDDSGKKTQIRGR